MYKNSHPSGVTFFLPAFIVKIIELILKCLYEFFLTSLAVAEMQDHYDHKVEQEYCNNELIEQPGLTQKRNPVSSCERLYDLAEDLFQSEQGHKSSSKSD